MITKTLPLSLLIIISFHAFPFCYHQNQNGKSVRESLQGTDTIRVLSNNERIIAVRQSGQYYNYTRLSGDTVMAKLDLGIQYFSADSNINSYISSQLDSLWGQARQELNIWATFIILFNHEMAIEEVTPIEPPIKGYVNAIHQVERFIKNSEVHWTSPSEKDADYFLTFCRVHIL